MIALFEAFNKRLIDSMCVAREKWRENGKDSHLMAKHTNPIIKFSHTC